MRTGGFRPFCTNCRTASSFPSSLPTNIKLCFTLSLAATLPPIVTDTGCGIMLLARFSTAGGIVAEKSAFWSFLCVHAARTSSICRRFGGLGFRPFGASLCVCTLPGRRQSVEGLGVWASGFRVWDRPARRIRGQKACPPRQSQPS